MSAHLSTDAIANVRGLAFVDTGDIFSEQAATVANSFCRSGRLNRITNGSNNPLPAPCEQCVAPPTGYSRA